MAACSSVARKPLKYALFENGHHPETIIELSRGIELDMSRKNFASPTFRARRTA